MRKKTDGKTRYAIYNRCSSDDQAHRDFSTTDVQAQLNREYAHGKGGTVSEEYKDEGISGTTLKRPGFQRLLDDAKGRKFDTVVVTYMSRLGRGETFTVAEYQLREAGVKVEMVKESFTDDIAGFVNKSMTQFVDGMYVQQVRQWTRTKMEAMVNAGYFCGGTVPFGYQTQVVGDAAMVSRNDKEPPKRLVPDPSGAPLLRQAFELFAETRSCPQVVDYLNGVTARHWNIKTITYLLRNEVYRGILRFGEWSNEAAHEPLVSEALWDLTREGDAARPRRAKKEPVDTELFYLRGLVHCGHCGTRMTPANHHGRVARVRYYECIACTQKRTRSCPVRRINAESLHAAVLREIQRAAEHPTRMAEVVREAVKAMPEPEKLDEQLSAVRRRLRETERKAKNCTAAIEGGGGGVRLVLKRLEELEAEQLALEAERQRLELQIEATRLRRPDTDQVQALWARFTELWEAATEGERNELMPLLVERVEMQEKERGFCRLLLSLPNLRPRDLPTSTNVAIKCKLGAGIDAGSIYPSSLVFDFFAPQGGQSRKRVPRPWLQATG